MDKVAFTILMLIVLFAGTCALSLFMSQPRISTQEVAKFEAMRDNEITLLRRTVQEMPRHVKAYASGNYSFEATWLSGIRRELNCSIFNAFQISFLPIGSTRSYQRTLCGWGGDFGSKWMEIKTDRGSFRKSSLPSGQIAIAVEVTEKQVDGTYSAFALFYWF